MPTVGIVGEPGLGSRHPPARGRRVGLRRRRQGGHGVPRAGRDGGDGGRARLDDAGQRRALQRPAPPAARAGGGA